MNSQERIYNGRAMRQVKRILDQGRSEQEINREPEWNEQEKSVIDSWPWLVIYLGFVFVLCFIASCSQTPVVIH